MTKKRHSLRTVVTLVVAASFVGCPLLKKKGGDEPDVAPDAATVTVGGTGAKNEANVLRYANETPLANEPAVIGKDGTVVRNFPGNGPEVATLAKGTAVAKIAGYFSTATLIMFDDPAGDGSKLLGWVNPKAFDVAAPPPTRTVSVPARILDGGVRDSGSAVVVAHDAGVVHATVDAGSLPQPPRGSLAVPPVDGRCPAGWSVATGMCRRNCAADADCPRGTKCVNKGVKVCSSG